VLTLLRLSRSGPLVRNCIFSEIHPEHELEGKDQRIHESKTGLWEGKRRLYCQSICKGQVLPSTAGPEKRGTQRQWGEDRKDLAIHPIDNVELNPLTASQELGFPFEHYRVGHCACHTVHFNSSDVDGAAKTNPARPEQSLYRDAETPPDPNHDGCKRRAGDSHMNDVLETVRHDQVESLLAMLWIGELIVRLIELRMSWQRVLFSALPATQRMSKGQSASELRLFLCCTTLVKCSDVNMLLVNFPLENQEITIVLVSLSIFKTLVEHRWYGIGGQRC